jgi:hypothetical protein
LAVRQACERLGWRTVAARIITVNEATLASPDDVAAILEALSPKPATPQASATPGTATAAAAADGTVGGTPTSGERQTVRNPITSTPAPVTAFETVEDYRAGVAAASAAAAAYYDSDEILMDDGTYDALTRAIAGAERDHPEWGVDHHILDAVGPVREYVREGVGCGE